MLAVLMALAMAPTAASPRPVIETQMPSPAPSSWRWQENEDYTEAYTGNESGSSFGVLCGRTCVVYVEFQVSCEQGHDYPAMINSSTGALQISLKCHLIDDRYVFTTDATTNYLDIMKGGGEIGFAIPLQSGRFGVSRFSLTGSFQAVNAAVNAAARKRGESQEGLRDFTI